MIGRGGRATALVAGVCLTVGLAGCGSETAESALDPATTTEAEPAEPTGTDDTAAERPVIDCDALDSDAIAAIAGGGVVEVTQQGLSENYTHTVGDRDFAGSSTGCDIDLDIGEFGPPELTVRVRVMAEDDFFDFFEETAAAADGFATVAGVGEAAFVYAAPVSRADLVADLGGPVLMVSLGRGIDGTMPGSDEMAGLAELVTSAVG